METYCQASGQVINQEKSFVVVSPNTDEDHAAKLCEEINFVRNDDFGTYLGLPSDFNTDKRMIFKSILDKVKEKLNA